MGCFYVSYPRWVRWLRYLVERADRRVANIEARTRVLSPVPNAEAAMKAWWSK